MSPRNTRFDNRLIARAGVVLLLSGVALLSAARPAGAAAPLSMFPFPITLSVESGVIDAEMADFDGDGKLDLAVASFRDNSGLVSILKGRGPVLDLLLPLGSHVLTLRVTDRSGDTATDEVTVTIRDSVPPDLATALSPALLWPQDRRLVDI